MELPYTPVEDIYQLLVQNRLLKKNVIRALNIAYNTHKDKKRDNGTPYLEEHIYSITKSIIDRYKEDPMLEDMVITALLHDVVEDNPEITVSSIQDEFGDHIAENIRLLTKEEPDLNIRKQLSQEEKHAINVKYINKISNSEKEVRVIKLEDKINNAICTQHPEINIPKYTRFTQELSELILPLADKTDPYYSERIKAEIERIEKLIS